MESKARRIPRKVRTSGRPKKRSAKANVRVSRAKPTEVVAFSVLCAPASGATLAEMRRRLSLRTIKEFQPDEDTVRRVVKRLWALGFDVIDGPGPVVAAQGTVRRFAEVFGVTLVKRTSTRRVPGTRRVLVETAIGLPDGARIASPAALPGALLVTVARPPRLTAALIPPAFTGRHMHLPGDIAQLMRASATHRRRLPSGDRATGGGITVAVIDGGFADHPFLGEHSYRITRVPTTDAPDPFDGGTHGTAMLAGLFACAPDVDVLAVRYDLNPLVALNEVSDNHSDVRLVSLSWGYEQDTVVSDPDDFIALEIKILTMIANGVTFVAAAGNSGDRNFPAMMPDVIAVGGVTIDAQDSLRAWSGATSFTSLIYTGRKVPDVCGIAGDVLLPLRNPGAKPAWAATPGGTSLATAQVAGIVALLLQKKPTLTPHQIRELLMSTATDVKKGSTVTPNKATTGHDLATGAGLANALDAWNNVT
jgi:serine protease AprX